jgi:N-acetylmuramic acid 6-phosphate (MurNAc-6-P) etherase
VLTALDQEKELDGTSGQARGRRRLEQKAMTVVSVYEGADMDDPQELLKIAQHHCQAILTIIDQLTEKKSKTELRLLSQRLQRLAFHAAPTSRDG